MVFLTFIGNIVTSILVGYLAFTNSLSGHIESLLLPEQVSNSKEVATHIEDTPLTKISNAGQERSVTPTGAIPRILLEHVGFQKAAVIASTDTEDASTQDNNVPLDTKITNALVNIYCQYKTDKYIRTTTGTGFFINQKGIILTNAHVAQFLLLKDAQGSTKNIDCVIRSGNPASPKYKAELLYISPTWIFENANLITSETPRGTGERDYALLYVSKSIDSAPLPARFPSIQIDVALLSRAMSGSSVVTAGYPAEALIRNGADTKIFPVLAPTTIGTLYTFGSNYADIFSISESPVGEQGASGGPIVTRDTHNVIGLIATKGDERTEGEHSLRAITLSYVDRTIIEETGFSLFQNMQGDPALRGNIFKIAMVPFLAGLLEEELDAGNQ
ncbi:MAG: serine protease [Candidatus Pacebacteria bacterium]|nr:serine protease [Candidatus Paceibacterota bacterium]MCF7857374.1 serine protease [Candidatus Paceibacterota bacterium]